MKRVLVLLCVSIATLANTKLSANQPDTTKTKKINPNNPYSCIIADNKTEMTIQAYSGYNISFGGDRGVILYTPTKFSPQKMILFINGNKTSERPAQWDRHHDIKPDTMEHDTTTTKIPKRKTTPQTKTVPKGNQSNRGDDTILSVTYCGRGSVWIPIRE